MSETSKTIPPLSRRDAMGAMGLAGLLGLIGCNSESGGSDGTATSTSDGTGNTVSAGTTGSSTSSTGNTGTTTVTTPASCALIPQETQGPYPLLAILSNAAMARQNITEGKAGLPLTLRLQLVNVNQGCAPISNAAVYIWHCDKDGVYSGYSQPASNTVGQTFLRGIQLADTDGMVSFQTIYPGWYAGRITHVHFQVYLNDNLTVTATATSQIAFPEAVTTAVYNTSLYVAHGQNSSVTGFASDNVFSDGTTYQMATLEGDVSQGYTATLQVGIAA
ncbi:intradiol ring-cleavage dioxygenase [Chitinivorax sp. PXF-14]|uniref:intradiol ring-cleavage dioxygenase n=1 Tax=Chitinivorax sp. PXF-14 TaxID=3230488 RepID=UPI00346659E8